MNFSYLFNPFRYIAGTKALITGVAIVALTAYLGYFNLVHFDGVFDMHQGLHTPIWFYFLEVFSSWLIMSVLLWISALILSKSKVRVIDIFGTHALAKTPMLIFSLLSFIPVFQFNYVGIPELEPRLVIFILISLVITIWMFVLMYNAYSVSANLEGNKAVISFVVVLVLAEILTKVLIIKSYFSISQ